jgi:hypothetical protein
MNKTTTMKPPKNNPENENTSNDKRDDRRDDKKTPVESGWCRVRVRTKRREEGDGRETK